MKIRLDSNTSGKNFYITTTLPYVNADLHIGHAMEFVYADIVARYKRLLGFNVFLIPALMSMDLKYTAKPLRGGHEPQKIRG